MKFSIITPSFNSRNYIRDCVLSVQAQEGVDWEHIVIDGGSTDDTLAILREYPHVQWISEPDSGMSEAINKGFRRATGDWLMWLNTDDYFLPDALAKVARFADQHPGADVIYGKWQFVDREKRILYTRKSLPYNRLMNIHSYPSLASTACFYRKKTTMDEGYLVCEQLRYSMDVEYYARLGTANKSFCYLPEVLAAFRVHGDNLSLKYLGKKAFADILELEKQHAEWSAIRRAYGITLSNNLMVNQFVDALLFAGYGVAKVVLRSISS